MTPPPRILLVFAHPDDESFAAAGVSRLYADAGGEIALITATRGDAGRTGEPPICRREALPAMRESELRRATAILGIKQLFLLDYHDQELATAPPDAIREELVRVIRAHRPHIVITFDPNGANAHTDHVAISRFAIDAANAAADARWYPALGPAHSVRRLLWTSPVLPWETDKLDSLEPRPGVDFVIDVSRYRKTKAEALRAHRTQHVSIDRCFFNRPEIDRILATETFRQAWGPSLTTVPSTDLFEGI